MNRNLVYFGCSPLEVTDAIRNAVETYLSNGVDAMETAVVGRVEKKIKGKTKKTRVTGAATGALDSYLSLLRKALDGHMGVFEKYALRKVFHVPLSIPVPDHILPSKVYTRSDEDALDAELETLRAKAAQARYVNAVMAAELDAITGAKSRLASMSSAMSSIRTHARSLGMDHTELPGITTGAVASLVELHTLIEGLREKRAPLEALIETVPESHVDDQYYQHTTDMDIEPSASHI